MAAAAQGKAGNVDDGAAPRVAVCLAGAWRCDPAICWQSILDNIVSPSNASVFVVLSNDAAIFQNSSAESTLFAGKQASTYITVEDLRNAMGVWLRAAVVWDHSDLLHPSYISRWAGFTASNASGMGQEVSARLVDWVWHLKRWACQSLIAADPRGPYDVVVTARPDLVVTRPWAFAFNRSVAGKRFSLRVGDKQDPVHIGEGEIVMSRLGLDGVCANDFMAVATYAAATTLTQLIHHSHSSVTFTSMDMGKCPGTKLPWRYTSGETMLVAWLWRAGLARQSYQLHIQLSRVVSQWYVDKLRHSPPASMSELASSEADPVSGQYKWERHKQELDLDKDGLTYVHGLCGLPQFARFGQMLMAIPFVVNSSQHWRWWMISKACVVEYQKTLNGQARTIAVNDTIITGGLPSSQLYGHSSCWYRAPAEGLSQRSAGPGAVPACGRLPLCGARADLMRPLPPCVRRSVDHFVAESYGYGAAYPYWTACNGPCQPLPNVSFDFGDGIEPAILYPYVGLAKPVRVVNEQLAQAERVADATNKQLARREGRHEGKQEGKHDHHHG